MEFKLKNQVDLEKLKQQLTQDFPDCKVKSPPMNNKIIMVQKGTVLVGIRQKKETLKVYGSLNTQNPGILIAIVIGVLLGIIGALVIVGILTLVKQKDYKAFEAEVGDKVATFIENDLA